MKKIILLFLVFFFIYPIYPRSFPLPIDRVFQGIGLALLVIGRKDLIRLLGNQSVIIFLRYTIILFILAFLARLTATKGDLYFLIQVINIFFAFFSSYLIYWWFRFTYEEKTSLGHLLHFIVVVALLQTLISSFFFLNPQYFENYMELLNPKTNAGILKRMGGISRRFMGVGSQFFSGSIKYGVAFFTLLVLPYIHQSRLTKNRFIYGLALLLISIGGLLTGRTFFVAIALGIFMILLIEVKTVISFIKVNARILWVIVGSLIGMYILATLFIGAERLNLIIGWAFEFFVNFAQGGSFESSSTNELKTMYKFPDTIKTWLIGDGRMQGDGGGYYMKSDVGYVRLIFYFGAVATAFFIVVWYRYSRILGKLTPLKPLKVYLFILFLWIVVLNLKGLTMLGEYFVLFLIFLVLPKNHQGTSTSVSKT